MIAEHYMKEPIVLMAVGGTAGGTGFWVIVSQATSIFGLISAFCGAVVGIYGVWLMIKRIKANKQ